jgi:hypothetical protein
MRTFQCVCNNVLFFDNSLCLRCKREVGYCPVCHMIATLLPTDGNRFRCGNPACGTLLVKCPNYVAYNVCNCCLPATDAVIAGENSAAQPPLCYYCRFTRTIPDLSVPGNLEKWYRLEAAKRRLFYDLDLLRLPYETEAQGVQPALRFDFKADVTLTNEDWRPMGVKEKVFTGHADGTITINVREADDVERERLRVKLGEAQRTLLGHFRHEIGHYYWDMLIKDQREADFTALFGDHTSPSYQEALKTYYEAGPPPDWQSRFVSAYATMHPWEDFAETFATYLDMVSTLDTAYHAHFIGTSFPLHDLDAMAVQYQQLGVSLNELNRSMGLLDVVPEVLTPAVKEKMRFIHQLIIQSRELALARQPAGHTANGQNGTVTLSAQAENKPGNKRTVTERESSDRQAG